MRKLGTTTIAQQSETDQQSSTSSSSLLSCQKMVHKLRGASTNNNNNINNNPYHNHNRILPPCQLYPNNKSLTMTNFDTNNNHNNKQNSSRSSKSKMMDYPSSFSMAATLLLEGIPSSGRTSNSSSSSSLPNNNTLNSRQKEANNNNILHQMMTETKNCRKESVDTFRGHPLNNGTSCSSHQHQVDGTFSSTTMNKQESSFSTVTSIAEEYHAAEKAIKKSSKLHKMRHSSKSLAMNLNDMIVGKKKTKIKRPLTSGNSEGPSSSSSSPSSIIENDNSGTFNIQKITSTRIFNNNNKQSTRTDKENLPPINNNKFLSLSQNQIGSHHHCAATEKKEDNHFYNNCNNKNCTKCNTMAQKLKSQVLVAKTLQRQNVCLENIVTQKRNLVEQLTRQVRTLVRENQQLSKTTSKLSQIGTMMNLDCGPTTIILPKMSPTGHHLSLPQTQSLESQTETEKMPSENNFESAGDSETIGKMGKERSASTTTRKSIEKPWKKSESTEKLEETEQALSTLSQRCERMQQNYDQMKQENQEINRFLNDLLYTLNARGYESVMDHEGNIIELCRCKGETFLCLKGKDARLRAPSAKRLAPQETLLKAVIGSQERIIQNLISQLEDHQKDSLLGACLSLEDFNGQITESHRNALLEGEVLTILGLLEGACQRNPDLYVILKEQHTFDSQVKAHSGLQSGNAIVEAILERCQKALTPSPSILNSKSCRRARENLLHRSSHHNNNNRAATPPYRGRLSNTDGMHRGGTIYSENLLQHTISTSKTNNNNSHPSTSKQGCSKLELDYHSTTTTTSSSSSLSKNLGLSPRGQSAFEPISSTTTSSSSSSAATSRNHHHPHLPQISRSSTQNPFLIKTIGSSVVRTNNNNSSSSSNPLIVTNGLSPRPSPPRLKPNSSSEVNRPSSSSSNSNNNISPTLLTEKNITTLTGDRCPYCARQFSSSTSLAEIHAHMEMHVYQQG